MRSINLLKNIMTFVMVLLFGIQAIQVSFADTRKSRRVPAKPKATAKEKTPKRSFDVVESEIDYINKKINEIKASKRKHLDDASQDNNYLTYLNKDLSELEKKRDQLNDELYRLLDNKKIDEIENRFNNSLGIFGVNNDSKEVMNDICAAVTYLPRNKIDKFKVSYLAAIINSYQVEKVEKNLKSNGNEDNTLACSILMLAQNFDKINPSEQKKTLDSFLRFMNWAVPVTNVKRNLDNTSSNSNNNISIAKVASVLAFRTVGKRLKSVEHNRERKNLKTYHDVVLNQLEALYIELTPAERYSLLGQSILLAYEELTGKKDFSLGNGDRVAVMKGKYRQKWGSTLREDNELLIKRKQEDLKIGARKSTSNNTEFKGPGTITVDQYGRISEEF